ncbi:MAG: AI-2E family transporter [Nocardioidaceae bacterium]
MREVTALPRSLLILLGLAAATVSIAGIRSIAEIVAPAFLALVLAIAVHPVPRWLRRHGVPGWLATVTAIVVAYAIVLALLLTLLVSVARLVVLLPQYADDARGILEDVEHWLDNLGIESAESTTLLSSLDLGKVTDLLSSLLGGLLTAVSNLFFLATLLLFLSADASWFPRRLEAARSARSEVVDALESFAHGTRAYLVVSTIFGFIVAVVDTALLWALGVPEPLIWGLLAFITNYVPNIGFVLGLIPPAILGLLEGGLGLFVAVVVAYSVVNVVIQSLIQPKFVGDTVGLATSVTFMSLVFWGWVLGPLGALLAIPLSLLAKAVLIDVDEDRRWLRPIVAGEPVPEEPVPEEPMRASPLPADDTAEGVAT